MTKGPRRTTSVLLALLLALAGLHLGMFTWRSVTHSLQLDLAAYVTAGQAVAEGLDPYRNWPDRDPPLWDGKAAYEHSRFLYPPLVAWLFAPLGGLPYAWAKALFTVGSLLALALACALLVRDLPGPQRALVVLGLATAYPLLPLLERGQVDAITLLLVVLAFRPALEGRKPGAVSGAWLALAVLLKLNAVFLAAFWLVRRFDRALAGFLAAAAALGLASLLLHGPGPLRDYVIRELPRIARYGEEGPRETRIPAEKLAELRGFAPEGFVRRDGRLYEADSLGFVANASLARVASRFFRRAVPAPRTVIFALAIVAVTLALTRACGGKAPPGDPSRELAFLSAALASVLLAGPLTWAMNTVWLLPAAVLLARRSRSFALAKDWALAVMAAGLLLVWLPDQYAWPALYGTRPALGDYKYVAGATLCLWASLALLRVPAGQAPPSRDAASA
jgi:hypothetical protein